MFENFGRSFGVVLLVAAMCPLQAVELSNDRANTDRGNAAAVLARYMARSAEPEWATESVDVDAWLPKLEQTGRLEAIRRLLPGNQRKYQVLHLTGDRTVKEQVIARYLKTEQRAAEMPGRFRSPLLPRITSSSLQGIDIRSQEGCLYLPDYSAQEARRPDQGRNLAGWRDGHRGPVCRTPGEEAVGFREERRGEARHHALQWNCGIAADTPHGGHAGSGKSGTNDCRAPAERGGDCAGNMCRQRRRTAMNISKAFFGAALIAVGFTAVLPAAELQPATLQAWNAYMGEVDVRMEQRAASRNGFLWTDESENRVGRVRRGEVVVAPVHWGAGLRMCSNGLIHHWIGSVFIPGASIETLWTVVHDYDHYTRMYRPAVTSSRTLACSEGPGRNSR